MADSPPTSMLWGFVRLLLVGAVVLGLAAWFADATLTDTFARARALSHRRLAAAASAERLARLSLSLENVALRFCVLGDVQPPSERAAVAAEVPAVLSTFGKILQADEPVVELEHVRDEFSQWARMLEQSPAALCNGGAPSKDAPLPHALAPQALLLRGRIQAAVEALSTVQNARIAADLARLEVVRRHTRALVILAFSLTIAVIAIGTIVLARRSSLAIARLVKASNGLSVGRFDLDVGRPGSGELEQLARTMAATAASLKSRHEQTEVLLAISRALTQRLPPDVLAALLRTLVSTLKPVLHVLMFRIDGNAAQILARDPPAPDEPEKPMPAVFSPEDTIGKLMDAQQTQIVSAADAVWPEGCVLAKPSEVKTWALVPLRSEDKMHSFLALGCDGTADSSQQWVGVLDLLGSQFAGAMSAAHLYDVLEAQNRQLSHANDAKSKFLALMSHELRTPLNSIIGFSEVLIERRFGDLTERQLRYLTNVHSSGRHLLSLINDLLDLSKIEAGRLEILRQVCSLDGLLAEAVTTLKPIADAAHVTVKAHEGSVSRVWADPRRVKQIVLNLMSNAIKFSPAGGAVTLTTGLDPTGKRVRVSVSDQGPGLTAEEQQQLFRPFVQLGTHSHKHLGSGLGLAVSHQLVTLMDGSIDVHSAPGKGATFSFELPRPEALTIEQPAFVDDNGSEGLPLALIVDDDPDAQELLDIDLRDLGFRTHFVSNGEEALVLANRLRPALILLDVFLPGIDGWEVLYSLRQNAATRSTPVVMVTIAEDRARALRLGAVEQLVKPPRRSQLAAVLAQHALLSDPASPKAETN